MLKFDDFIKSIIIFSHFGIKRRALNAFLPLVLLIQIYQFKIFTMSRFRLFIYQMAFFLNRFTYLNIYMIDFNFIRILQLILRIIGIYQVHIILNINYLGTMLFFKNVTIKLFNILCLGLSTSFALERAFDVFVRAQAALIHAFTLRLGF